MNFVGNMDMVIKDSFIKIVLFHSLNEIKSHKNKKLQKYIIFKLYSQ
jgi:hypothetical protein